MIDSTYNQIEMRIRSWQRGTIFFISDFADLGSTEAVRQALNRLTKAGVILRPGRGVYCFPEITPAMPEFGFDEGVRTPSVDEIAQAIAKRDCCRICPTAPVAQHYLRLSQQVPMNVVYFTDGSGRRIQTIVLYLLAQSVIAVRCSKDPYYYQPAKVYLKEYRYHCLMTLTRT